MHRDRALWVALGVLLLAGTAFMLRHAGPNGVWWLPGCSFHQLTGLNCPGCGMTRAAHATLQGRFAEAFRFNPVGMVALPVAGFGLMLEIIGWVRGRPTGFRLNFGPAGTWTIAIIFIGFWVFRNLPWWPFTLLAPPA